MIDEKTLLKNYQDDLENLEKYIEEFSSFLPLSVCTLNPTNIVVDINQAARELIGYTDDDIIGQGIEILFKDKKSIERFFKDLLKQKIIKGQEMVLIAKDKEKIPVSVSGSVRKDESDNVIGFFLAISDITETKKFQEELEEKVEERTSELEDAKKSLINMLEDAKEARQKIQEEENKTRATLISLTDGLVVFDKNKKITLVNPEAEKILKIKEAEVLRKKIDEVLNHKNFNELYQVLGKKVEWTGQKYELTLKETIKRYFQVSIAPVVVGKETVGLMVILHDVTRGKEIERLKTEFVSIAAHQLRTPLSAIKWTLRMLLDGDIGNLTAEQIEFLAKGYQSNERMIIIINDLLNVARIEEGRFICDLAPQSIDEIIQETLDGLSGIAKDKNIKLTYKKPKTKIPKVNADREKIGIVIQNLLDNAVRFNNPGGEVTVSIKCDKVNLEVAVEDNGIGIPDEQKKRIFNKFFRADNAVRTETKGTGLGLFIVKNIINAHKGKILFESKKGKGTTFKFTLPVK